MHQILSEYRIPQSTEGYPTSAILSAYPKTRFGRYFYHTQCLNIEIELFLALMWSKI